MKQLVALEHRYRTSTTKTEELREARNAAIIAAIAAGHTQADIARATGLTTARINQIAKQQEPRS